MYTLDFKTIKQVMQAHQKTGSLHAKMPSGIASLREPCQIEIIIMAGAIASCTIIGNSGRYLTGENAIQELSRLGQLSWTFTPKQEGGGKRSTGLLPAGDFSFFSRRVARLEPWQMNNLSRLHRAVFALVDGTKSAAKIAEMLSTSPDLVNKALNDLQSLGIITTRQQDGRN
jgi:biotin operon repressor